MKRLLAFVPLALLIWASSAQADFRKVEIPIDNNDIKIFYYDLPEFTDQNANFSGIKKKRLTGRSLLKDPQINHLVLVINYDRLGTADNLVWSLEEWTVDDPFDRDLTTAQIVESEIFKGKGRLFIRKRLRGEIDGNDLKNKKVIGTTNFEAGNGALLPFEADKISLGGHQGSVSVTGKLDSGNLGDIVLFKGNATGTVFINDGGGPEEKHQVMITIKINAKRK